MRDQEHPEVFGHCLDRETLTPIREGLAGRQPNIDYGCDPLGEVDGVFMWKMVPSGDIVNRDEMRRRLPRLKP